MLQDKLNFEPDEKERLENAIESVDPQRRGSIHIEQFADLSARLALGSGETKRAEAALGRSNGLIHLDEFKSWYADRAVKLSPRGWLVGGATENEEAGTSSLLSKSVTKSDKLLEQLEA